MSPSAASAFSSDQFEGEVLDSVASSIAAIAALPPTVLMFQVKLRKSRQ
jgi:hypothetical protein